MQRRSRSLIALFSVPIAAALVFGVGAASRSNAPEDSPLTLTASLSERTLTLRKYGEVVKTYGVAVGSPSHPTPKGSYGVRKIVWNPPWIPPDEKWAKGKSAKGPGERGNPMKTVKIFFNEPDYYIHGTGDVNSIGEAASHGCLRMDPNDAAEVALMVMENGGVTRDWDWVKNILNIGESKTVRLNVAAPLTVTN
jgi:lipoprotein-anchoring transpeptidase ErfK/SrfK